uniref:Uncharacterized protein n=1 Tax=Arundo donax TaxID=35708 RepID=A0A0A9DGV8_ARUDO
MPAAAQSAKLYMPMWLSEKLAKVRPNILQILQGMAPSKLLLERSR